MIRTIQGILVSLSFLTSQVPAFLIFRGEDFIPPFYTGKNLYILATEVLCTIIFALVIVNRNYIQKLSLRKLNKRVFILLSVIFVVGLIYFLLLMNKVYRDGADQRIVIPLFPSEQLSKFLQHEGWDVLSIDEEIRETTYDVIMYNATYCIFFILYNALFGFVVLVFAALSIRIAIQGGNASQDLFGSS